MPVEFDKERALGVNMCSGRTVPSRGVSVSKDIWADLDDPIKLEKNKISRCSYEPNELYDDQVVAVSIDGNLRQCLYLFDSYDKIEGVEYVIHPSHNQANVINIEFFDDHEWDTSVTTNRSIEPSNLELFMVSDEYLLEDVGFSTELVASEL